jgi:hypothetical protein
MSELVEDSLILLSREVNEPPMTADRSSIISKTGSMAASWDDDCILLLNFASLPVVVEASSASAEVWREEEESFSLLGLSVCEATGPIFILLLPST